MIPDKVSHNGSEYRLDIHVKLSKGASKADYLEEYIVDIYDSSNDQIGTTSHWSPCEARSKVYDLIIGYSDELDNNK